MPDSAPLTAAAMPWYPACESARCEVPVFCPNCGVEDRQQGQFCRACGDDLRAVRASLVGSGSSGDSVTAREEIGRAVAAKIRELHGAKELKKVVEDVLPEVEKFLESPAERRMRRVRTGVLMSGIGLGAMIFFALVAANRSEALPVIGVGAIVFLVGLAYLLNGWHFSRTADLPEERDARDSFRDILGEGNADRRSIAPPPSVVEQTTRQLEEGATGVPRPRATGE
jgi:hypothetical protein